MKNNIFFIGFILALDLILVLPAVLSAPVAIEPRRRDFTIKNARLRKVGYALITTYNVNVCTEEARMFSVAEDTKEKIQELNRRLHTGITLELENATLEEALDALCKAEPVYMWEYDAETNHYTIFPKEESSLNWKIGVVEFKDKTLADALMEDDVFGFEKHGVEYMPPFSSNNTDWLKISFRVADVPVRKALNKICQEYSAKLDREYRWMLYETGRNGILKRKIVAISPSIYKPPKPRLPKEIVRSDFALKNADFVETQRKLIYTYKKTVCIEKSMIKSVNDLPVEMKKPGFKLSFNVTIELKNVTLAETLDAIIELNPLYKWKIDQATGIINIYPKVNAPFDWKIDAIDIKDKTLIEIFQDKDMFGLRKHGIGLSHEFIGFTPKDKKISLSAKDITIRDALNRICSQFDVPSRRCGLFWTRERKGTWSLYVWWKYGTPIGSFSFTTIETQAEPDDE